MITFYFSTVEILTQKPTDISSVATVSQIDTKLFFKARSERLIDKILFLNGRVIHSIAD